MFEIYSNRIEISNPGDPVVAVDRFIDGYQSRNERLADIMRRFGICEEKSSGIDRVVHDSEFFELPAADLRYTHPRTVVTIFGPRSFEDLDRDDRIRACYQHCVLRYVTSGAMPNQSLRDRFNLHESKSATVSQIIAATIDAGLIKPEKVGGSRKYASYLPYWALVLFKTREAGESETPQTHWAATLFLFRPNLADQSAVRTPLRNPYSRAP
ncbi:MAG: ATP-binding protein [Gemmatimonadota bacterium]